MFGKSLAPALRSALHLAEVRKRFPGSAAQSVGREGGLRSFSGIFLHLRGGRSGVSWGRAVAHWL